MTPQKSVNSGFGATTTAEEVIHGIDLRDKIVIVTGGHSGIGLETTKVLSAAGATVYVGARDLQRAEVALKQLKNVHAIMLDLSDSESITQFAEEFLKSENKLHVLINNAGVMALPELTRDSRGYEMQFATNHLGHFQLTLGLWPALKNAQGARVVNLTSAGHRFSGVDFEDPHFTNRPYDKWKSYGQSKTANSLFNVELDQRGKSFNIRAFAVHPGRIVGTDLVRHLSESDLKAAVGNSNSPGKDIPQGAATTIWCAVSKSLEDNGGVYCADCDISAIVPEDSTDLTGVRKYAVDLELAKRLWIMSEELISPLNNIN